MAEFVKFSHDRLLIGFRKSDWTRVWYEPAGHREGIEVNEEGDVPLALYQLATGPAQAREPLEGEISWFPFYNIDVFRADGAGSTAMRKLLQRQFLWDCWRYMHERDLDRITQLEEEFDRCKAQQWQAWYTVAKREKRKQGSARAARRVSRTSRASQLAAAIGQNVADIEVNSDSSDDSGFESYGEGRMMSRKSEMPPPRNRPASRGTKRTNPNGGRNGRNGASKKKKGPQGRGRGRSNDSPASLLPRSGGSTPRPGGGSGSAAVPIDDDDDEDDDTSALGYDSRQPERPSTGLFVSRPANEFDGREYMMGDTNSLLGDASTVNGGLDEEEAVRRAIEASVEPEAHPLNHGGPSEEEAPRRTIEQSLEPPERPHRTPE